MDPSNHASFLKRMEDVLHQNQDIHMVAIRGTVFAKEGSSFPWAEFVDHMKNLKVEDPPSDVIVYAGNFRILLTWKKDDFIALGYLQSSPIGKSAQRILRKLQRDR